MENKKEAKVTEYLICRKDRYLTLTEVKQIKSELGKEIFNRYLRIEKLADYIYTIRFKQNTTLEEAKIIIDYVENINKYYKVYRRKKSYTQIKLEQQRVSEEKQRMYQAKTQTKYQGLSNLLAQAKEMHIQRLERAEA